MREFSAPATFTIADDESVVDAVFEFAESDPDLVVFLRQSGDRWVDVTAAEFARQVTAAAKGLIALGVQPGDRVALMSATRYEWPLIDYAIWATGAVTVPIYETSSPDQVEWILRDSAATALVVETDKHTAAVRPVADAAPELRHYLQIDPSGDGLGAVAELTAAGAEVADADVHERIATLRPDSPATLIYTSGTTGRPKGCELTHDNLLSEARGAVDAFSSELRRGRRSLMFLPMAHVLARAISIAAFQAKVAIGHFSDIPQLVPTFAVFRPNFILSVPRVFEKVYNTARQKAHTGGTLTGRIFDLAETAAIEWSQAQEHGGPGLVLNLRHMLFDRLVYAKLRAALGGECSFAISGGAPLGERLGHFFRGIGVTIYEGYGLTESTAAVTVNTIGAQKVGTVGKPLAGNTIRIDDDGEILLRGGVVFREYWNNPAATTEAITDGWFHTGDLGAIDAEGYLTITGRKKEIIVTAGGKNVAPAVLEDGLRAHPLISQAMVVGDKKPFIGALITIDPEEFPRWKERNGKPAAASVAGLVADPDLIAEIDDAVREANQAVSHAESIKKFRILPVDFTEETGEMTPTMKIKRNVIAKTFADDIDAIYAK